MIGFEVRLNGQRVCTAGAGQGVLTTIVSSVAKRAELKLEIGGLLDNAHLAWVTPPRLTIGDEITIRIVETEQPDPASSIKRDDPKLGEDGERKYYERLKNKYEGR